jgi:hypothetical protein
MIGRHLGKVWMNRRFPAGEAYVVESVISCLGQDALQQRKRQVGMAAVPPAEAVPAAQVTAVGQFDDDPAHASSDLGFL